MIAAQIRREPAARALAWYLPVAVIGGTILWWLSHRWPGVLPPVPGSNPPDGFYPTLIVVWSWSMSFLLSARLSRHCSGFLDPILPVTPRRLWIVHVLTVVASGLSILAVAGLVMMLGNLVLGHRPLLEPGVVSIGLHLAAGYLLALAIVQSPSPGLVEIPLRPRYVTLIVATFAGWLALILVLSRLPRAWTLVPLALAAVLGVRIYRRLPDAFTLKAESPGPARGGEAVHRRETASRRAPGPRGHWLVHATIWRSSAGNWTWFYPAALAFHGFILSFGARDGQRVPYIFFSGVILLAWTIVSWRRIAVIDAWPVSRRRVFAVFALPLLLAITVGYGSGSVARRVADSGTPALALRPGACCNAVPVPPQFLEIAWDGVPPRIDSPWGESWQPAPDHVVGTSGPAIYRPYDAPLDASADFVALQVSRAVAAVHGEEVPWTEIRDRYLRTDSSGRIRIAEDGFLLTADGPNLGSGGVSGIFPLVLALVAVPWLLLAAMAYGTVLGGAPGRVGKMLLGCSVAGTLALGVAALVADAFDLWDMWAATALVEILVRRATERFPGGVLVPWVLGAAAIAAVYRLAEGRFNRAQAPLGGARSHVPT